MSHATATLAGLILVAVTLHHGMVELALVSAFFSGANAHGIFRPLRPPAPSRKPPPEEPPA